MRSPLELRDEIDSFLNYERHHLFSEVEPLLREIKAHFERTYTELVAPAEPVQLELELPAPEDVHRVCDWADEQA